jgi:hypothetical protein
MVKRRKFLVGFGSLAAGSAAVLSTGAHSSASLDRQANIDIVDDSNGVLALTDESSTDLVRIEDGNLLIDFDTGSGTGVAPNSVYTINHAFGLTNNDGIPYDVTLTYELDDYSGGSPAWANIFFYVTDGDGNQYTFQAKEQSGNANSVTVPDVTPGEMLDFKIRVDVKGADTGDNLNGTLHIDAKEA